MTTLTGLHVTDAGVSVATAHAARVLDLLGAEVVSLNPGRTLLGEGPAAGRGPATADVVIVDAGTERAEMVAPVVVEVAGTGGDDPGAVERLLQERFGLAALTGDAQGPPLLTGGWPVLLHTGAQAAVAALLGAVERARGRSTPVRLRVDAAGASAWLLGEAATRAGRGIGDPARRGVRALEAEGRLVRVRDGWVSLRVDASEARMLDDLAAAEGTGAPAAETSVSPRSDPPPSPLTSRAIAWLAAMTRAQAVDRLGTLRIPCGAGLHAAEVVAAGGAAEPEVDVAAQVGVPRMAEAEPPLAGLRVIELGAMWAGPGATAVLAAWGAEVVKVEGPGRPDGARGDGTRPAPLFAALNAGKRSVALDPGTTPGRDGLLGLLRGADLLLDAHSPRVLPNWGLGPGDLRRLAPDLAVLHLPALAGGPAAMRVAYGLDQEMLTGQAMAGGDIPMPCGVPLGDPVAATAGAAALLALLWRRLRTGEVVHLRTAQRDLLLHQVAGRLVAARRGASWLADREAGRPARAARAASAAMLDPHMAACGAVASTTAAPSDLVPRPALLRDGEPAPPPGPVPAHGEHTGAVLTMGGRRRDAAGGVGQGSAVSA